MEDTLENFICEYENKNFSTAPETEFYQTAERCYPVKWSSATETFIIPKNAI